MGKAGEGIEAEGDRRERAREAAPARPRLVVLACSATKSDAPGRIPAIERYQGPLWQTLRIALREAAPLRVAYLSARWGFGDARFVRLPDYDAAMTAEVGRRMIDGGIATRWPRPVRCATPDTVGIDAASEMASMSAYGRRPFVDVAIVGGHRYLEVARSFVAAFKDGGWIDADAAVAEINGPIGLMRRDLRRWIVEAPDGRVATGAAAPRRG